MLPSIASVSGNPWCFRGKPTGDGFGTVTATFHTTQLIWHCSMLRSHALGFPPATVGNVIYCLWQTVPPISGRCVSLQSKGKRGVRRMEEWFPTESLFYLLKHHPALLRPLDRIWSTFPGQMRRPAGSGPAAPTPRKRLLSWLYIYCAWQTVPPSLLHLIQRRDTQPLVPCSWHQSGLFPEPPIGKRKLHFLYSDVLLLAWWLGMLNSACTLHFSHVWKVMETNNDCGFLAWSLKIS